MSVRTGMRTRRVFTWLLLILVGQSAAVIAKPFSDGWPQALVISTSIPKYPPLAVASNTKGAVLVDVAIDSGGKVLSAITVEGHPLLRRSSEAAAMLWSFQTATSSTSDRHIRLRFVFDIVFADSTETTDEGRFIPPFTVEVIRRIGTIAPLPRVSGHLPEEKCPLHGEVLKLDVVPISYGLPRFETRYNNIDLVNILRNVWKKLTYRESYFAAENQKFANSHTQVYGGCIVGLEKKAEVLYCQRCRAVEAMWRKRHPNKGPEMAAVISGGNGK